MMCAPRAHRRSRSRKHPTRPDRPRNKLGRRSRRPERIPLLYGSGGARWPKGAERILLRLFKLEGWEAGIDFDYEPDSLPTGLAGQGKSHIRPDFRLYGYDLIAFGLEGYDLYIEVTTGQTRDKEHKIAGAHRLARTRGQDLVILLFDNDTLDDLGHRRLSLHAAVARSLEAVVPVELALAA